MRPRRLARNMVLQALFEIDAVGHDPERTLGYRLEEVELSVDLIRFSRNLLWGVLNNKAEMDEIIHKHASAWPIDEIAILDRTILRMGLFELLHDAETPPRVVINEAVELAKRFGNESTRRFVNGVLGAILSDLEQSGRLAKGKGKPASSGPEHSMGQTRRPPAKTAPCMEPKQ